MIHLFHFKHRFLGFMPRRLLASRPGTRLRVATIEATAIRKYVEPCSDVAGPLFRCWATTEQRARNVRADIGLGVRDQPQFSLGSQRRVLREHADGVAEGP